jgi:hypothetical protein
MMCSSRQYTIREWREKASSAVLFHHFAESLRGHVPLDILDQIGDVEQQGAFRQCHCEAIYAHLRQRYRVTKVDPAKRAVYVTPTKEKLKAMPRTSAHAVRSTCLLFVFPACTYIRTRAKKKQASLQVQVL